MFEETSETLKSSREEMAESRNVIYVILIFSIWYSVLVALTGLLLGYGIYIIVVLTGLPIGYGIIVVLYNRSPYRIWYNCSSNRSPYRIQCNSIVLTGLSIGYSIIVVLIGVPIGYSVIVAASNRSPYRIQCNTSSSRGRIQCTIWLLIL